jgi:hypothetical protein
MTLQTEYEFTLPKGYLDPDGTLHKEGVMRLATAADEILPMKDARVQNNPAYLTIILLSRVITRLGELKMINTQVVEGLFAEDLNYLQGVYRRINEQGGNIIKTLCPKCEFPFEVEIEPVGEL